ncbi:hypothetical protein IGI04_013732 [Brassica rapa subsp. trilocularis]|uniref:Uncharacterized protein n=1 Tax=Brassica rapa subsp. trilocularis TaxID=1813537 RepID=A0ABQ7N9N8_BRACM|nr:hypothetical protein IGI04_013732 [Brassica rapa subsp. trilocularis]
MNFLVTMVSEASLNLESINGSTGIHGGLRHIDRIIRTGHGGADQSECSCEKQTESWNIMRDLKCFRSVSEKYLVKSVLEGLQMECFDPNPLTIFA